MMGTVSRHLKHPNTQQEEKLVYFLLECASIIAIQRVVWKLLE